MAIADDPAGSGINPAVARRLAQCARIKRVLMTLSEGNRTLLRATDERRLADMQFGFNLASDMGN